MFFCNCEHLVAMLLKVGSSCGKIIQANTEYRSEDLTIETLSATNNTRFINSVAIGSIHSTAFLAKTLCKEMENFIKCLKNQPTTSIASLGMYNKSNIVDLFLDHLNHIRSMCKIQALNDLDKIIEDFSPRRLKDFELFYERNTILDIIANKEAKTSTIEIEKVQQNDRNLTMEIEKSATKKIKYPPHPHYDLSMIEEVIEDNAVLLKNALTKYESKQLICYKGPMDPELKQIIESMRQVNFPANNLKRECYDWYENVELMNKIDLISFQVDIYNTMLTKNKISDLIIMENGDLSKNNKKKHIK